MQLRSLATLFKQRRSFSAFFNDHYPLAQFYRVKSDSGVVNKLQQVDALRESIEERQAQTNDNLINAIQEKAKVFVDVPFECHRG